MGRTPDPKGNRVRVRARFVDPTPSEIHTDIEPLLVVADCPHAFSTAHAARGAAVRPSIHAAPSPGPDRSGSLDDGDIGQLVITRRPAETLRSLYPRHVTNDRYLDALVAAADT